MRIGWLIAAVSGVAFSATFGSCDYFAATDRAKRLATNKQIASFRQALDTYRTDVGVYPTESQGLTALWANPGVVGWKGPYLQIEVPPDPWAVPYRYRLVDGRPDIASSRPSR